MSTPVGDASTSKKGLGKYVARMKSVLKKPDGSKRLSFVSKPATEPASTGEATSTSAPDAKEVVAAKATR